MTYFPDLTPCDYGPFSRLEPVLAVGWLDPPFDFPRGTVKRAVRDRLQELLSDPWSPILFLGVHNCGFCEHPAVSYSEDADDQPCGAINVFIPGRQVVFLVPDLILHYIDEHQYCPPPAFTDAVAACPAMESKAYFLALMAAGGTMPAFVEQKSGRERPWR